MTGKRTLLKQEDPKEHEVLRIAVDAERGQVRVLAWAAYASMLASGFEPEEAARARIVVEELALDAVERCAQGSERDPKITMVGRSRPDGLTFDVRDRGIPPRRDGPALRRARQLVQLGFVEGLSVFEVTPDGPLAQITVRIPPQRIQPDLSRELEVLSPETPPLPQDAEVSVRRMKPEDAFAFARLVYRCWGYTYDPDAYDPEKVSEALSSGRRVGAVAVDSDGEVVAHFAYRRVRDGIKVVEGHAAMVDPRYRLHGLLNRLVATIEPTDVSDDIVGVIAEPVMIHTATQHLVHQLDGHDVGILFKILKPVHTTGFEQPTGRLSVLCTFRPFGDVPERVVYPPPSAAGHLSRVLETSGLRRTIASPAPPADEHPRSILASHNRPEERLTTIEVKQAGDDLLDRISELTEDAVGSGSDVVHLDLPANEPELAWFAAGIGELGYVFGALLPECGEDGDVLRLQYLKDVDLNPEEWHIESPQSVTLVADVVDQLHGWHAQTASVTKERIESWRRKVLNGA